MEKVCQQLSGCIAWKAGVVATVRIGEILLLKFHTVEAYAGSRYGHR